MTNDKKNVFISYSHHDRKYLERLQIHLKPLERDHGINIWADSKIDPGSNWREQIRSAIDNSQVAILLISADFLASDFINQNELPPLLETFKKDGGVILPVILNYSRFLYTDGINVYQAINNPQKPLCNLPLAEKEKIWVKVSERVEAAFKGKKPEKGWEVVTERRILEALIELIEKGSETSFLIISSGDYYVQFIISPSTSLLICEAVQNNYLPEELKISKKTVEYLKFLGFSLPTDNDGNFYQDFELDNKYSTLPEIASIVMNVFIGAYKLNKSQILDFKRGYPT